MPSATKRKIVLEDYAYGGTPLPAGHGGRLILGGDDPDDCLEVRSHFWFEILREDEEGDLLQSVLQIADEDGCIWEARSVWDPEALVLQVGALTSIGRPSFWSELDQEWRDEFTAGLLIEGCRVTLDDRFYRWFTLGGQVLEVQMKYQGVILDLAASEQEHCPPTINARVSKLYCNKKTPDGREEVEEVPPFVFQIDFRTGLFIQRYDFEDDSCQESSFPRSVVFQKTTGKGEPQEGVRYEGPKA